MKQLLLLRHAKSSWDDPDLDDFDRPLAERGLKAAKLMGRELAARDWLPDQVLVSSALRTRDIPVSCLPMRSTMLRRRMF